MKELEPLVKIAEKIDKRELTDKELEVAKEMTKTIDSVVMWENIQAIVFFVCLVFAVVSIFYFLIKGENL